MELEVMAMGVLLALGGVARAETVQVELLEDEVAEVFELRSGKARRVPRASLPPGTREGDVVVDGRIDDAATARAKEAVRRARARAFEER